jgi:signal transduction histidine kinase
VPFRQIDRQPAVGALAKNATIAEAHRERDQIDGVRRPEQITPDGLAETLRTLSGRVVALEARNRELASEVQHVRAERRLLRSQAVALTSSRPSRTARTDASLAGEDERRRSLERDLHDGVQNELVALIVKLRLAEQDRDTPPALAGTLSALADCAEATLDSVREIARGIYPPLLTGFGVMKALRVQAGRAPIDVRLVGTAPRSTQQSEAAVYFSGLEAIQNAAKHAGHGAQATLTLQHHAGTLEVRIQDDGQGFDPELTPDGAGLSNIHDRIQTLRGTVKITSSPKHGTLVTIALPWPSRHPQTAQSDLQRATETGGGR